PRDVHRRVVVVSIPGAGIAGEALLLDRPGVRVLVDRRAVLLVAGRRLTRVVTAVADERIRAAAPADPTVIRGVTAARLVGLLRLRGVDGSVVAAPVALPVAAARERRHPRVLLVGSRPGVRVLVDRRAVLLVAGRRLTGVAAAVADRRPVAPVAAADPTVVGGIAAAGLIGLIRARGVHRGVVAAVTTLPAATTRERPDAGALLLWSRTGVGVLLDRGAVLLVAGRRLTGVVPTVADERIRAAAPADPAVVGGIATARLIRLFRLRGVDGGVVAAPVALPVAAARERRHPRVLLMRSRPGARVLVDCRAVLLVARRRLTGVAAAVADLRPVAPVAAAAASAAAAVDGGRADQAVDARLLTRAAGVGVLVDRRRVLLVAGRRLAGVA